MAPMAQLESARRYERRGCRFESCSGYWYLAVGRKRRNDWLSPTEQNVCANLPPAGANFSLDHAFTPMSYLATIGA